MGRVNDWQLVTGNWQLATTNGNGGRRTANSQQETPNFQVLRQRRTANGGWFGRSFVTCSPVLPFTYLAQRGGRRIDLGFGIWDFTAKGERRRRTYARLGFHPCGMMIKQRRAKPACRQAGPQRKLCARPHNLSFKRTKKHSRDKGKCNSGPYSRTSERVR